MAVEMEHCEPRPGQLAEDYRRVRRFTELLAAPLSAEDCTVQSMPDASPTKWHLAHTTWFFETFVLAHCVPNYPPVNTAYAFLFNSYYTQAGDRFPRPKRGILSRPGLGETFEYRHEIDRRMLELLHCPSTSLGADVYSRIVLGLHHEQQHQELILTDVKHLLAQNPLDPAYLFGAGVPQHNGHVPTGADWISFPEGTYEVGDEGSGFSYDNESPRHKQHLKEFALASRPVTNSEYLQFIDDGGYERPELWLSDGFAAAAAAGWKSPFYWQKEDNGSWSVFTLGGRKPLVSTEPVCHVSYYEADAYARWAGESLPLEGEWELAATMPITGNFAESGRCHPAPAANRPGLRQMFGDIWEWTQSPYAPYPGFKPIAGALGEYNGKFMCSQFVLRGGSCATPQSHIRRTYRNFFYPDARWQFAGIRLARR